MLFAKAAERVRVLVLAREAGAAAALAPVVRYLGAEGDEVHVIGLHEAVAAFERGGVPLLAFPGDDAGHSAGPVLDQYAPDALLTGTSMYPDRDAAWWAGAREREIPSLALLDHSSTPRERFSVNAPFDCVPDAISTVTDSSAAQLESLGCPVTVRTGGHPHFGHLVALGQVLDRDAARRALALPADQAVLVFVSEPLAREYGTSLDYKPSEMFPFTEKHVLGLVRQAFTALCPAGTLLVKLHPLEDSRAYDGLALEADPDRIRVMRSCPPEILIGAADVVVGMTSALLIEAALMGAPTASVRPGDDPGALDWAGPELLTSVCDPADLPAVLEGLFSVEPRTNRSPDASRALWAGSSERVAGMVRALALKAGGA